MITVFIALADLEKTSQKEVDQSKLDGTRQAFERFFPSEEIMIIGKHILVKNWHIRWGYLLEKNPQNENGARENANLQLEVLKDMADDTNEHADFFVAVETGVYEYHYYYQNGLCFDLAIISKSAGFPTYGHSSNFILPPHIYQEMKRGNTFEEAVKIVFPRHMYAEADDGLIAILSRGALTRKDQVASAVMMALLEQTNPYLYQFHI